MTVWYGLSAYPSRTCLHMPEHTSTRLHERPGLTLWLVCSWEQAGTLSSLTRWITLCAPPQPPAKSAQSASPCARLFVCTVKLSGRRVRFIGLICFPVTPPSALAFICFPSSQLARLARKRACQSLSRSSQTNMLVCEHLSCQKD